jgi:predicted metalloprotease with PDZ domain
MGTQAAIRYEVHATAPAAHRADVVVTVEGSGGRPFDLVVPSWVLGSYWIQDRVRGISGLRADPADAPVSVTRLEKARWRVDPKGSDPVRVTYSLYGNELVTALFDLTVDHMFLGAGFALPYVDGRRAESVEVALHLPAGWTSYAELPLLSSEPPTYRAEDFDELVDSPIDAGRPEVLAIPSAGAPHRIVLCGAGGNHDGARLTRDVGKVVDAAIRMFGESPLPSYTFFLHLDEQPSRGLEHRRSSVCVVSPTAFRTEKSYRDLLGMLSHEYFHLYNVKRIRPAALADADLSRETYTRMLWAMEGTTSYLSDLLLRRAEVVSADRYLSDLAEQVQRYRRVPGRLHQSLEEASLIAWVDFYRGGPESPNRSISYYGKGSLVSMGLDLEIRAASAGARSLESVWRDLWRSHGRSMRGIGEDELEPLIVASAQADLAPWFRDYVRGTVEVDLERHLARVGLTIAPKPKPRQPDDGPLPGDLRIMVEPADGNVRISVVADGGTGRAAGLSPGDELVAIDGQRLRHARWSETLERYPAGSRAELTLFRRHRLLTVPVTFGEAPAELAVVPVAGADEEARTRYAEWMGVPWTPPKAVAPN